MVVEHPKTQIRLDHLNTKLVAQAAEEVAPLQLTLNTVGQVYLVKEILGVHAQ
jgi:hypothetical protein